MRTWAALAMRKAVVRYPSVMESPWGRKDVWVSNYLPLTDFTPDYPTGLGSSRITLAKAEFAVEGQGLDNLELVHVADEAFRLRGLIVAWRSEAERQEIHQPLQ
jgi:hypothetical protein